MSVASANTTHVEVNGIDIAITWKSVKRLSLSVHPPAGDVRVSAPFGVQLEIVMAFIEAKMSWLQRHREAMILKNGGEKKLANGSEELVWGDPCRLEMHPFAPVNSIVRQGNTLHMLLRTEVRTDFCMAILQRWRRDEVRRQAAPLLEQWRLKMQLPAVGLAVRTMKSRWGSCLIYKWQINLNGRLSELAPLCLTGVIVHELTHFQVPNHSPAFYAAMDQYFPRWREVKAMLDQAPVAR